MNAIVHWLLRRKHGDFFRTVGHRKTIWTTYFNLCKYSLSSLPLDRSPFSSTCLLEKDRSEAENCHNTRIWTSIPLADTSIYRYASLSIFLVFMCDGRVSNPCFPFRSPEIDFRSGILKVTRIVSIGSSRGHLLKEIVCHAPGAMCSISFYLVCSPQTYAYHVAFQKITNAL